MVTQTADNSSTIYSEQFKQHYHSIHGAKQESDRIFIELGLAYACEQFSDIHIFEMGFGTGLNAYLSAIYATQSKKKISYTGIEAYPISEEIAAKLHFSTNDFGIDFLKLHQVSWQEPHTINPYFEFTKFKTPLHDFASSQKFNLVYYDAFAPEAQPELWTVEVFEKIATMLEPRGILTTYCSKSYVQRNFKTAGFSVEKHQGPKGKREVLRAIIK